MRQWYEIIMNSEKNPLRTLQPAQRFQVMTALSVMWTSVFCSALGLWLWYAELVMVHLLVLLATLLTALTFQKAKANGRRNFFASTYRDYPAKDGATRYDDVWGG